jgi:hypothetical protein
MDLTSCLGKIETFFNAKENVTIPQSSSSTLACVDVDTSIAILDRTSTFIMPLLVITNVCFPMTSKLKFLLSDCYVVSTKS